MDEPDLPRILFLVDALDEYNAGLPELLDIINDARQGSTAKWLVTSRNWPNIESAIGCTSPTAEASSYCTKAK